MNGDVDLVLSGGGVLGVGHVGVLSVLNERGYSVQRVAGTSAGAIVGALVAAGAPVERMTALIRDLDYAMFLDKDTLDRLPLIGPPLSVLLQNGYAEGDAFADWLGRELEALGVRTFADLRCDDHGADDRTEHRWRLMVMASDVTRGQLLRLPQDYTRYGLDPDKQLVADAVRASISVPYLFEPAKLQHAGGTSLLVDGGLISNYPLDAFDRTDEQRPRWPTFGVTLIPELPAGSIKLVPALRGLRAIPALDFLESVVATAVVGRDQGYLAQPWVQARSMSVDSLGINPFDFAISREDVDRLYESGRTAALDFLERWSFEDYTERFRAA